MSNIGDFILTVRREIKTEIDTIAYNMGTGKCVDYPQYMKMVGEIKGLQAAESVLVETEARLRKAMGDHF